VPIHHLEDQAARCGLHLLMGQTRHEYVGQPGRILVGQVGGDAGPQRVAEPRIVQHAGGELVPGDRHGERLGEQLSEVQHLDVVFAERVRERVVLGLRPAHPRDRVEQQRVVVARGQAGQFVARSVQHDRCEPADLTVHVVRHGPEPRPLAETGRSSAVTLR
jgi:hypothetical protein